jgi:hypothetical protein
MNNRDFVRNTDTLECLLCSTRGRSSCGCPPRRAKAYRYSTLDEIIKYQPVSEALIQSEFYHQAKLRNVPCLLTVKTKHGVPDILVMNSTKTEIIAVVEVKRGKELFVSEQLNRYKELGLPLFKLCSLDACSALLDSILALY